MITIFKLEI